MVETHTYAQNSIKFSQKKKTEKYYFFKEHEQLVGSQTSAGMSSLHNT